MDFHVPRQTCWCQGKSGPGKIHEVILVHIEIILGTENAPSQTIHVEVFV